MIRRARLVSVVTILAAGAVGVVSSTQTWLVVGLAGTADELAVSGSAALPVLAPLSLALLALGLALSIVGRVMRWVFGTLALAISIVLAPLTWRVVAEVPTSAVASTVTQATGITGDAAISQLVSHVTSTPWPVATLVAWVVLLAASILVLVTAHSWQSAGRRYDTSAGPSRAGGAAVAEAQPAASRPADYAGSHHVDDWDDLSRGEDPTA